MKRRRACPSFIFFPSMHPSPSSKRERSCVNYRSSFSSARIDFCHRDFCRPLSRNARGKFIRDFIYSRNVRFPSFRTSGENGHASVVACRRFIFFSFFYLCRFCPTIVANFPFFVAVEKLGLGRNTWIENETGRGYRENFSLLPSFRF